MGWDCTAKRAAERAYAQAEAEFNYAQDRYDDALALCKSLDREQQTVQNMMGNYDKAYAEIKDAGNIFLTNANCDILNGGYKCLASYSAAVKEAQISSRNELSRCAANLEKARNKKEHAKMVMDSTHCVWKDDPPRSQ